MGTTNRLQLGMQADKLRTQFKRRHADKQLERSGDGANLVLYALDNDVITVATAPWNAGHQSYLSHLINGDEEAKESLAYIFAEYFLRPEPMLRHLPFLILPPGDVELQGLWNAAYLDAHAETVRDEENYAAFKKILKNSEKANQVDSAGPEQAAGVLKLVRELLEALEGRRGAIAHLRRIVRVQESESILPVDRVMLNESALLPVPDESARREIAAIEKQWLADLNKKRKPRRRAEWDGLPTSNNSGQRHNHPTNNSIDAAVLARIEWINRVFEAEKPQTRRLCFVSGDTHIENIAEQRRHGNSNVADCYIRNPSCFLADPDFFRFAGVETPDFLAGTPQSGATDTGDQPRLQGSSSMREWLFVLFPESSSASTGGVRKPVIEDEVQKAIGHWASYLKLCAAKGGLREANDVFEERVRAAMRADQFPLMLERLVNTVLLVSNDAMTAFSLSGMLAGFWSLDPKERWSDRIIPAVKFESFPIASELNKDIMAAGDLRHAQRTLTSNRIDGLRSQEDPTGYTVFVALSLAFAHANEWRSAYTLAKAAYSKAAAMRTARAAKGADVAATDDKSVRIKGDEAAYLCGVFRRYGASEFAQLRECTEWTARARELQMTKPRRKSIESLPNPDAYEDPRFVAEELAVSCIERNLEVFMYSPLAGSMSDQLFSVAIRSLCTRHLNLLGKLAGEPETVRHSLQQQLATNFLQLLLLGRHKGLRSPDLEQRCPDVLQILQDSVPMAAPGHSARRNSKNWPTQVEFVFYCASAVFYPTAAGWNETSAHEALVNDTTHLGRRLSVMPYDQARATAFISLVKTSLNLPH